MAATSSATDLREADLKTADKDALRHHVGTLGHLRLRHAETNEIILVPQPSNDPGDPLNWYVHLH